MSAEEFKSWSGLGAAIGVVLVGVMNKLDARKAEKAVAKAQMAAEIAAKVANDTHTLVNSNMGLQLRTNAALARRIASLPTATADDIAVAAAAEKALADHEHRQAIVDKRQAS